MRYTTTTRKERQPDPWTMKLLLAMVIASNLWVIHCILPATVTSEPLERPVEPTSQDNLWEAIWHVESSGRLDPPDGDGGASIGPLQIQRNYWLDGTRFLGVNWPYKDARRLDRALRVAKAYVTHYQQVLGYPATPETWARIHNGGPRGPQKTATKAYWAKVQNRLYKP